MSDINVTVNENQSVVSVTETPINVYVADGGTQGPVGAAGVSPTGFVFSLNNLTGILNLTGQGGTVITLNGQTLNISGDNSFLTTGNGDVRYLSINSGNQYYLISNPSGYITTGISDSRYLTINSGNLIYSISNPSGFLTSGQSVNLFYLTSNPQQYTKSGDVSLLYYTKNNESGFITNSGFALISYTTGISGVLQNSINNISNSNIVYTTGNQTISGNKTFINNISIYGSEIQGSNTNTANITGAHSEGIGSKANGRYSHAEGESNEANGYASHAEGTYTLAYGNYSHVEGSDARADALCSHVEGLSNTAYTQGEYSHAEGHEVRTNGLCSHAEGGFTDTHAYISHTEGYGTQAFGTGSHSEGYNTISTGHFSHSEGNNTISTSYASLAIGGFNVGYSGDLSNWRVSDSLLEVGIGTGDAFRKNALTIYKNGNIYFTDNLASISYDGSGNFSNLTKDGQLVLTSIDSGNINLNIQSTGQNNYNLTTNLSGRFDITGSNLSNLILGLTGKLQESGTNLYNLIDGIKNGTGVFYDKNNPSGFLISAITGINITGGNNLGNSIGISAGNNITLLQLGNTGFSISATAGGSSINSTLITGSGTNFYIPRFDITNTGLVNSTIIDSGISVSFTQPININSGITFNSGISYNYASGEAVRHRTALKFINLTPSEYANLTSPDSETLYIVTE